MIDKKSGILMFDNFAIYPYMSMENLINIIGKKEIISYEKDLYINLFLKPQKANGKYFLLRLFFEKESEELKYC